MSTAARNLVNPQSNITNTNQTGYAWHTTPRQPATIEIGENNQTIHPYILWQLTPINAILYAQPSSIQFFTRYKTLNQPVSNTLKKKGGGGGYLMAAK